MKQVILIHGSPDEKEFYDPCVVSPSNNQWFPWIQRQLALKDILSQALEFPKPYDPVYEEWVKVLENFKIDKDTILIGHSCGGGFLLRYLSEHPDLKPQKVILVAPWLDPLHELSTNFFDFEIDSSLSSRTELHVFISTNDHESILKSFEIIKAKIPNVIIHEFKDKGHFIISHLKGEAFPELLEVI